MEFTKIPTVTQTEAKADPDETRKALAALARQGRAACASRDEIKEVLAAVTPGNWGTAKNKNQLYDH